MGGDVVHQSSPVRRERETVTDLVTGVNMTATLVAGETWCAGVTTVSSSVCITTLKTTAVRSLQPPPLLLPDLSQASSSSLPQVEIKRLTN